MIRRGWYLGKDTFKDRFLKLMDKAAPPAGASRNRTGEALREHGEKEAERIVRRSMKSLQLAPATKALTQLLKSDPRKAALASLLRERTSVSNGWIAARLAMGDPRSVSRMLGACKINPEIVSIRNGLAKELDQVGKKGTK